jgi:hypothetical protein
VTLIRSINVRRSRESYFLSVEITSGKFCVRDMCRVKSNRVCVVAVTLVLRSSGGAQVGECWYATGKVDSSPEESGSSDWQPF